MWEKCESFMVCFTAVDKSKMPKSVIKSIEKDAKKKKEKRPNKSGAPKKDSVAVAAPVFDPTSLRQKASKLTGSAVRDELAQVLIEYPNAVSAWPIRYCCGNLLCVVWLIFIFLNKCCWDYCRRFRQWALRHFVGFSFGFDWSGGASTAAQVFARPDSGCQQSCPNCVLLCGRRSNHAAAFANCRSSMVREEKKNDFVFWSFSPFSLPGQSSWWLLSLMSRAPFLRSSLFLWELCWRIQRFFPFEVCVSLLFSPFVALRWRLADRWFGFSSLCVFLLILRLICFVCLASSSFLTLVWPLVRNAKIDGFVFSKKENDRFRELDFGKQPFRVHCSASSRASRDFCADASFDVGQGLSKGGEIACQQDVIFFLKTLICLAASCCCSTFGRHSSTSLRSLAPVGCCVRWANWCCSSVTKKREKKSLML